jgi:hypothetical protein
VRLRPGTHDQRLPRGVAGSARIELEPVQDALAGVRVEQHRRTVVVERAIRGRARVDPRRAGGLSAATRRQQPRRIGRREIDALREVHEDLYRRAEAVELVERSSGDRHTVGLRQAAVRQMQPQTGGRLRVGDLEARRRIGQQALAVVEHLALVRIGQRHRLEQRGHGQRGAVDFDRCGQRVLAGFDAHEVARDEQAVLVQLIEDVHVVQAHASRAAIDVGRQHDRHRHRPRLDQHTISRVDDREEGVAVAAAQRRVHRRDQLVDRDLAVGIHVELRTLRRRHDVEGDIDAEDELIDRDGLVAVTVTDAYLPRLRGSAQQHEQADSQRPPARETNIEHEIPLPGSTL